MGWRDRARIIREWPFWLTLLVAALLFAGLCVYWTFSGALPPDYMLFWLAVL